MCLNDGSNDKPQTKRKGYSMRTLFVTVVAALLTIAIALPVQAEQVVVTSPCSDCEKTMNTAAAVLPQGESEQIQPIKDHTWGGDPDDLVYGSIWDLIMCLAYWSPDCNVYYHQTIWF